MIENAKTEIRCKLKLILKHCEKVLEFFPCAAENAIAFAYRKLPYIHKRHVVESACLYIESSRFRKIFVLFSVLSADAQLCQR